MMFNLYYDLLILGLEGNLTLVTLNIISELNCQGINADINNNTYKHL